MHQAPQQTAPLMQWARTATPQGSLFVVPPDAWDDFGAFRIVAERGLYITCNEVNQLAFDASIYQQGNQRVAELGVKIPAPHTFDARGYYALTLHDLQRLCEQDHADYIVFEKKQLDGVLSSLPTVYHDENLRCHQFTRPHREEIKTAVGEMNKFFFTNVIPKPER